MPAIASNIPSAQTALNNFGSLNQLSIPSSYGATGITQNKNNLGAGLSFNSAGAVNSPSTNALGIAAGIIKPQTAPPAVGPASSVIAKAPVSNYASATIPSTASSSPGSYKGTPIVAGTQQSIQQQMAAIDAKTAPQPTLPQAPVAPQASLQTSAPYDPSTNPYTGSTATTPTQGSGTYTGPTQYSGQVSSTGQQIQSNGAPAEQSTPGNPYIGQLAGAATGGNQAAQGYTQQTANYGAGNIPIAQQAQGIANNYGQQIANVGGQGARFESGQLTTGTSPVAEGNAAVTAQTTAAQQQALATGESAALQGIGYQLTGQNQAASAANEAAGQAYVGQDLQQTGIQQAGSLAQPQLGAIGQVPYLPGSGQQGAVLGSDAPGGLAGAAALQGGYNGALAEAAAQGTGTAQGIQALAAAPGVGSAAGTQALAAAQGTGQATGIEAQAAAPGQTAASNYQTTGTAQAGSASSGFNSANQTYQTMSGASNFFDTQAATLQSVLASSGLNQGSPYLTSKINSLSSQLGSAKVAALTAAVSETQTAYNALLSSSGQTPTASEEQSLSVLNPNSTPAQISAAIGQLKTAAYNKLNAQYGVVSNYYGQLGQGNTVNSGSSTTTPSGGTKFNF
jgi:hypothetical protein